MNTAYCPTCNSIRRFSVIDDVKLGTAQAKVYAAENAIPIAVEMDCSHITNIVTRV